VTRSILPAGGVGLLAVAIVSSAILATAAPAGAVEVYNPVCPPADAVRGVAVMPTPALDLYDKNAEVTISAGALPAGVVLTGDVTKRVPYVFSGTPTTVGTSTFTVKAQFEDAPSKSVECTMTVSAGPAVGRIEGTDRYDQAVQVSKKSFDEADTVYLASGERFPDALSAGAVAGLHDAPLLLTPGSSLTGGTKAEIARLHPDDIVVVGGPVGVSDAVVSELEKDFADATVTRIGGADRFEVSRALITNADFGVPSSTQISLASGTNFPDALAASPAAVSKSGPVLLVNGAETVPTTAESAVLHSLGVRDIRIAGGTASVSQALQTSLSTDFTVKRASGADRFETAVAINKESFAASTTIYLASGLTFPDALSAAPVAGADGNPIYLVRDTCVPMSVLQEVVRLKPTKIVVLGGHNALGAEIDALKPC
jgi:putative cell wall-binding protein